MARSPPEWRESAKEHVDDTLVDIHTDLSEQLADIGDDIMALRRAAYENDPSRDVLEERTAALTDSLIALAHTSFDAAADVRGFKAGPTLRNLRGKEPIGYSKRDGGAAHDVVYGSRAMNKSMSRRVSWPLRLSEWDKERAGRTRDGIEPVEATGTKKYTKQIGGRTVHVVVDERGMSPI